MLAYQLNEWLNKKIVDEFEIAEARAFSPETRIDLPELTYAQELLNTPIPFDNRVEFLSDYVKPTIKSLTGVQIAKELGISKEAVKTLASELNASTIASRNGLITYEPFTLEVLQDELEWQQSFEALDEYLSSISIAKYLGREEDWVERYAYELAIYPVPMTMPSGREALAYPKTTAWMLRTIMLHFPPANDQYSMADLEDLTGKSRDWISRVLKPHSFPTSLRTVAVSRLVTDHYEPAVAEYLTRALNELPPPAGNWLSVNRISELLQRDKKWVETRIRDYEQLARYLLDDSNKVILHYPVEVFEILKQQSEENFLYPPAGDYITEKTIAERMNRSQKWVRNRRSHIEQFAEERRNDANRVYMYYPESVIEILEATESRQ